MSDESGRTEVYITPLANPGDRIRVSTAGGREPSWSPDGRRLFYRSVDALMRVDLGSGPTPAPGEPRPLVSAERMADGWQAYRNYDRAADGRRFVIVDNGGSDVPPVALHVILNWFADLDRRVPAGLR
jgi:WD40 repeat protein